MLDEFFDRVKFFEATKERAKVVVDPFFEVRTPGRYKITDFSK